ncbi:MAG TPA: DUF3604 domain-containing protein [Myxococcota bacterium]|nr:DUF3604 domain-containing protein [Myxococcota bacterium]
MTRTKLGAALALLVPFGLAACGEHQGPGTIEGAALPAELVESRAAAQAHAARALAERSFSATPERQILFGDLHVHTTFSADAFVMGLPIQQGDGAHPIADACDFARYCSAVDFWSITDHAEALTPRRWQETVDSVRQCNAVAGDPANPDVVALLGWEWTQIGRTPETHYGHKNVILREWEEGRVPPRPIHSASFATQAMRQQPDWRQRLLLPLADWEHRQHYFDLMTYLGELRDTPFCPDDVPVHELPADCSEGAATPEVLYRKLDEWGFDSLVIPHGTTWGLYTPPGSSWDKQLDPKQHDPERQTLIEVFSGHGNSEEYRSFRDVELAADGAATCPAPQGEYEPCCWRAGELIRARCEDPASPECDQRVADARANFVAAGVQGRLTVPGAQVEDWGNCGTCPDCFLPAFNYRPKGSVQYILSLSNFAHGAGDPLRFRFGFLASSDNHSARPGTGYKEYGRIPNTEARGPRDPVWYDRINEGVRRDRALESVAVEEATRALQQFQVLDFERQASFFLTGGLVALHAEGRSRESVWRALEERAVYGTSGDRILLWFDLLNAPGGVAAMGSEAKLAETPIFRVRAAGSLKQLPGCPDVSRGGLSPERVERLCRGECYHPGNERHRITRIEVVRIRPQERPGEPVDALIQDPWRTLACPDDESGCTVEFDDPDFLAEDREILYYVRAIQEPTPAVNAGLLRCQPGEGGACERVDPCYGDYRTPRDEDCLAPNEERAWSTPIYVGPGYTFAPPAEPGTTPAEPEAEAAQADGP